MQGTFLPNLDTLDLWVLELFAMYDRRTDRRTDKSNTYFPFPMDGGIINIVGAVDTKTER